MGIVVKAKKLIDSVYEFSKAISADLDSLQVAYVVCFQVLNE